MLFHLHLIKINLNEENSFFFAHMEDPSIQFPKREKN